MEVEVTWGRAIQVWWAFSWRNFIAIVVAMFAALIVGLVIGFIMAALGAEQATIAVVTAPVGFVLGLAATIVPLRMILNKEFGEFRLALISRVHDSEPPSSLTP